MQSPTLIIGSHLKSQMYEKSTYIFKHNQNLSSQIYSFIVSVREKGLNSHVD